MSKKTAFGGNNNYNDFKSEGGRIAKENDTFELKKWILLLDSDDPISVQQASAVCYAISDISPNMFRSYQKELIEVLKRNVHPSGPRFTYRVLAEISIDNKYQGEIIDLSFKSLMDSSSSIAVQVFAMTVIANLLDQYPELSRELEAALQFKFNIGSPGFKNRALKIARGYGLKIE